MATLVTQYLCESGQQELSMTLASRHHFNKTVVIASFMCGSIPLQLFLNINVNFEFKFSSYLLISFAQFLAIYFEYFNFKDNIFLLFSISSLFMLIVNTFFGAVAVESTKSPQFSSPLSQPFIDCKETK